MGAPKSADGYDPRWEYWFDKAYAQGCVEVFPSEKIAMKFRQEAYYYRKARKAQELAAQKLTNLLDNPIQGWSVKADKVEIVIRQDISTGQWIVRATNKMDGDFADILQGAMDSMTYKSPLDPTETMKGSEVKKTGGYGAPGISQPENDSGDILSSLGYKPGTTEYKK